MIGPKVDAAALALAGWYLMCGPQVSEHPPTFDTVTALSKWSIVDSYDTADSCRNGKTDLIRIVYEAARQATEDEKKKALLLKLAAMTEAYQCIATDDPRLKEK